MCGMTFICGNMVRIKSFVGVCMILNFIQFQHFVTLMHAEVTLALKGLHEKYLKVVFIGLPYLRMLERFTCHVIVVKEPATLVQKIKCRRSPYFVLKFLMFGALISWVLFPHLMVLFIFYLRLIMLRNGWKQKPPVLMIIKWLQIL